MAKCKYGQPMEGQLLEEWVHQAGEHPDNWYTAEEHHEAAVRFARKMARVPKRAAPYKSVIIEGEPGTGKSRIANYYATMMAVKFGCDVYTDEGTFFYGIAFSDAEMLGAFNHLERGAVFFCDEANQFDRAGRDNSIIGELRASHYQVVRKNQCTIVNASANSDRMSRGTRSRADEFWHGEKLTVRFSPAAVDRMRRQGRGVPRRKNHPSAHAYAVLKAKDRPFRQRSIFDAALGREIDPKAGVPIRRTILKVPWMRKVTPLYNSFKPVAVGAAQAADNDEVMAIVKGTAPGRYNGVSRNYIETVAHIAQAFYDEHLVVPPDVKEGGIYQPVYLRASDILHKTGSPMGTHKFAMILRDDLGVPSVKGKGYEMTELYESVQSAMNDATILPELQRLLTVPGDDEDE